MKKFLLVISLMLAVSMLLTACGNNNAPKETTKEKPAAESTVDNSSETAADPAPASGNDKVNPYDYRYIGKFNGSGLAPVQRKSDNKYGYVDTTGRLVIPCIYTAAGDFSGGMAVIRNEGDDKYGFIDTTGKQVIPSVYDSYQAWFSDDGYAVAEKNSKRGLIDRSGNTIIPFEYDYMMYIHDGILIVPSGTKTYKTNDGYTVTSAIGLSVMNVKGEQLTAEKYDSIIILIDGENTTVPFMNSNKTLSLVAESDGRKVLLSLQGDVIGGPFDSVSRIALENGADGFIVEQDGKKGVIEYASGTMIVPCEYNEVLYDEENLAFRIQDSEGLWGYCDRTGILIAPQFRDLDPFRDGLAGARTGKAWGYIDVTGQFVIEPQFKWHYVFSDGLALIMDSNSKFGYMDKTGTIVLEPIYSSASSFSEGLAFVKRPYRDEYGREEAEYCYIDHSGNVVFSGIVKSGIKDHGDLLMFKDGIAYGKDMDGNLIMFNTKGEVLVKDFDYLEFSPYDSKTGYGTFTRYINGYGYSWLVNKNGETVIPQIPSCYNYMPADGFFTGCVDHSALTNDPFIYIYDAQGNKIL